MIPVTEAAWQTPEWRSELARAVTDPAELLAALGLDPDSISGGVGTGAGFRMRVPRPFIARMRRGDPDDPLLRQVLPRAEESLDIEGYGIDPVGELGTSIEGGVLRKYAGRALVITTGACAVHCRYCFRRHFPYPDTRAPADDWHTPLTTLADDPSVQEAILSGGDPLSLSDRRLARLVAGLDAIPHLRRLRIHTRQPVVLPMRVDADLMRWLSGSRLQKVVVVHVNHPAEIDDEVVAALGRLRECGATLLNQSVLLRGVNDSTEVLAGLSERLFEAGVLPYYLHVLDRVAGAAHFDTGDDRACAIHSALQARLPGYLVPRLVREVPDRPSKTLMGQSA